VTIAGRVDRELRDHLPKPAYHFARRRYDDVRKLAGRNPGRGRVLPDFLVIGTAKSGTTTLYGWLSQHPLVEPATTKEVHFFDYEFARGLDWYRSHFPLRSRYDAFVREHGRGFLTGEASPTYISHEWAPSRIARVLPSAKLVVAFRNPVDRAYSQFQMSRRENEEPLESFADAVAAEEERLAPEHARSKADRHYNSWRLGTWSYLWRSSYAEQVARWLLLFPREQFHFVATEELEAQPQKTLDAVYEFLGLPPYENADLGHLHVAPRYDPMPADVRAQLVDYFRPRNERLYELVGTDFGWDR
jgi:Sulfotransferase domain